MWIFLNDAFLSVVEMHGSKDKLLVRARRKQDLRIVFPKARIEVTPKRDYQFRTVVSRKELKQAMAKEIDRIDYTNFKDSVPTVDRHDAYLDVWRTMLRWSYGEFKPEPLYLQDGTSKEWTL